jgi:hypothetical protein
MYVGIQVQIHNQVLDYNKINGGINDGHMDDDGVDADRYRCLLCLSILIFSL